MLPFRSLGTATACSWQYHRVRLGKLLEEGLTIPEDANVRRWRVESSIRHTFIHDTRQCALVFPHQLFDLPNPIVQLDYDRRKSFGDLLNVGTGPGRRQFLGRATVEDDQVLHAVLHAARPLQYALPTRWIIVNNTNRREAQRQAHFVTMRIDAIEP